MSLRNSNKGNELPALEMPKAPESCERMYVRIKDREFQSRMRAIGMLTRIHFEMMGAERSIISAA